MESTEQVAETKNGIAQDDEVETTASDAEDEASPEHVDALIEQARVAEADAAQKKARAIKVIREEIGLHESAIRQLRATLAKYIGSGEIGGAEDQRPTDRPPPKRAARSTGPTVAKAKPRKAVKPGRLPRRTDAEIGAGVASIVACVKKAGNLGARAEEIRHELGLDVREMPKLLKTAVKSKQLRAKGAARARTYFAK